MSLLSRRQFVVMSGAAFVLGACGSSQDRVASGDDAGSETGATSGGEALVRFFEGGSVTAGTQRRIVLGLADADGVLKTDGPDRLDASLTDLDGAPIAVLQGVRRQRDIPRPYYEFRVDLPRPSTYRLAVQRPAGELDIALAAVPAGSLRYPEPGEPLPGFDTPTTADGRGVDPVCTRDPICPFHERTLTEALAAGGPVAYLIGTPAYCKTGICGPVLDVMMTLSAEFPDIAFVHSEVYTDRTLETVAPAVDVLGLPFEPVFFVTDASGTVVERLDVIFDTDELRGALERVST